MPSIGTAARLPVHGVLPAIARLEDFSQVVAPKLTYKSTFLGGLL